VGLTPCFEGENPPKDFGGTCRFRVSAFPNSFGLFRP
jgi:hypothetical protein